MRNLKGQFVKGSKLSELEKQKIREGVIGMKWTKKSRLNFSKKQMGKNNPMFGVKQTQETKEKRASRLRGQKRTPEQKLRMSIAQTKVYDRKGRNPQRRNKHEGIKYVEWRTKIFQKDNWVCQTCQTKGGYLQAHHIKSWKKYPELRYDISNGITLCKKPCHLLANKEQRKNEKSK